jgi:uncharacterized protein (DUF736 family)
MIIGKFTQQEDGFIGWINTAGLGLADVRFSPMPVKQGNGPDFIVLGTGDTGDFELGAAWAKTSKKGKPYLSVRLDSPAFVAPINCGLTKQADDDDKRCVVRTNVRPTRLAREALRPPVASLQLPPCGNAGLSAPAPRRGRAPRDPRVLVLP